MGETTVETRSRPVLFSGPMIKAILNGKKVQTRRVMKPQPPAWVEEFGYTAFTPDGCISGRGEFGDEGPAEKFFRCPFGRPGDLLWVRETYLCAGHAEHGRFVWAYRADGIDDPDEAAKAAGPLCVYGERKWRPSIHMFRMASRITLRIDEIRVERLQSITGEDARAEGVEAWMEDIRAEPVYHPDGQLAAYPVTAFARLWDSINGHRPGCAWADNLWVRAITFERIEPEGDRL